MKIKYICYFFAGFFLFISVGVVVFDLDMLERRDCCGLEGKLLPDDDFLSASFSLLVLQRRDEFSVLGAPSQTRVRVYDEAYSQWSPDFNSANCCIVVRENGFLRRLWRMQKVVVEIRPDTSTRYGEKFENVFDVCGYVESLGLGYPLSLRKPLCISD